MRKLVAAASMAIVLAGCSSGGAGGDDANTGAGDVDIDSTADLVELMRKTTSFEYDPYPTPGDMLEAVDIALVGEVVSVDPALQEMEEGPPIGAVLVGLQPSELWKDDAAQSGDVVYYWFTRPTNLDIGLYQEGLPEGTEVVLFGHDATDNVSFTDSGVKLDNYYSADPQGYFIEEAEDRLVNVWAADIASSEWGGISNIDDLRTSLGKQ